MVESAEASSARAFSASAAASAAASASAAAIAAASAASAATVVRRRARSAWFGSAVSICATPPTTSGASPRANLASWSRRRATGSAFGRPSRASDGSGAGSDGACSEPARVAAAPGPAPARHSVTSSGSAPAPPPFTPPAPPTLTSATPDPHSSARTPRHTTGRAGVTDPRRNRWSQTAAPSPPTPSAAPKPRPSTHPIQRNPPTRTPRNTRSPTSPREPTSPRAREPHPPHTQPTRTDRHPSGHTSGHHLARRPCGNTVPTARQCTGGREGHQDRHQDHPRRPRPRTGLPIDALRTHHPAAPDRPPRPARNPEVGAPADPRAGNAPHPGRPDTDLPEPATRNPPNRTTGGSVPTDEAPEFAPPADEPELHPYLPVTDTRHGNLDIAAVFAAAGPANTAAWCASTRSRASPRPWSSRCRGPTDRSGRAGCPEPGVSPFAVRAPIGSPTPGPPA
ncbi:hypothetical protein EHYA_01015 [Embleya hyalina]|uniref:Uncharacterized protein n=1 Tax=Embleya hyalina TaxID=516124 RepID=A0A401YFI1_9ACTN|nr:hypothetical protein EHYA_01015 [Embleya hyalina]